jgi:hypothetical protein
MDRTFTINGSDGTVHKELTYTEMRRYEAFFRGMRISYTIIYPDGYKITCEIDKQ